MKSHWALPNREQTVRRSVRLLAVGIALVWLGVLIFSLGLVEYCAVCRVLTNDPSPPGTLLVLLPIGLTISFFAIGLIVSAAPMLLGAWVWERPFPRVSVLAVAALLIALMSFVPLDSWAATNGLIMNWPGQSYLRDPVIQFAIGPLNVGVNVSHASYNLGYSTMSGGTPWTWPILFALPASLLCVAAIIPWRNRNHGPGPDRADVESYVAKEAGGAAIWLKRTFWTALAAAAAFVALEVAWYRIYVGDYPLNPEAAIFFRAIGRDFGGGMATLSLGTMLAAAVGLFITLAWRLSMRRIMAIVAVCAAVMGIARWFIEGRLVTENGALAALATVEPLEYPPGVTQQDLASQFGISPPMTTTVLRLPLVEPLSWLGPGSLALVAVPFLVLAIFHHRIHRHEHEAQRGDVLR